jgi:hypothetical protein
VRLAELPRRASERLARHVLGDDAAADVVTRVVERAAGNAFFLEELLRGAAAGDSSSPATVLAMLHARLEGLRCRAGRRVQVTDGGGLCLTPADKRERSTSAAAGILGR